MLSTKTDEAPTSLSRAVFFDRDGVLNEMILNPKTDEFESPHDVKDLHVVPESYALLRQVAKDFKLFVVTNQPSFAKGKTSLEAINDISKKFIALMKAEGVEFAAYYCCLHHPEGHVSGYSKGCECRKPSPYFLKKAAKDFNLDLKTSWMVGDRDTDIECGNRAGCQTILIKNVHSEKKRGHSKPTYVASDLQNAVHKILHLL